jgi:hypothetical protein
MRGDDRYRGVTVDVGDRDMGRTRDAVEEEMNGPRRSKTGKTKASITVSDEIAWRLGVVARMRGISPGELVEPLISPYLRGVRLPYDSFRRGTRATAEASPEPAGSPADRERDSESVLPIPETLSPTGGESAAEEPGKGRGRKRSA